MDLPDHLATTQEGVHLLQDLLLSIQDSDACRPHHLVTGEGHEVAVKLPNIYRHVRDRLSCVYQAQGPHFVGPFHDLLHGVYGSEDVGDVGQGDQLRLPRDELVVLLQPEGTIVVHIHPLDDHALQVLQKVPRDGIGVMLHDGGDHLVPFLQVPLEPPPVGDGINGLRSATGVHHLLGTSGVDELPHLITSVLELLRGLLSHLVDRAVNVGRVDLQVLVDLLDDLKGLLGRGCIIQIRNQLAVNLAAQ